MSDFQRHNPLGSARTVRSGLEHGRCLAILVKCSMFIGSESRAFSIQDLICISTDERDSVFDRRRLQMV